MDELKSVILDQYKDNKIVFITEAGITSVDMTDFIDQKTDEILSALGLSEEHVLSHLSVDNEDSISWYALIKLIETLHKKYKESTNEQTREETIE